jgi:ubiquinone/menaquinone biosynthesis C-methylase UbiE
MPKPAPSLANARRHYSANVANVYDARRARRSKWTLENDTLAKLLKGVRGTVLDVPVGTGRFLTLYKTLGLDAVGVDCSNAMLDCAHTVHPDATLYEGDVTKLGFGDGSFDTVVCVRLLHLIKPSEVPLVMSELLRVARHSVIVTIHLASTAYVRGRSQVHTRDVLNVPTPWKLGSSVHLMNEKGMPYYMLHFVR